MLRVPWSNMITSFPFIAIVLCNFTYEWGVYTFETLFPVFQKNILQLDIKLVAHEYLAVCVSLFVENSSLETWSNVQLLHATRCSNCRHYSVLHAVIACKNCT